ncbi:hypothetical protein [Carnobacterium maltaromaticum]|uniref:hypothetical protein n=1 Tax=Carnobacterium maltaromaticum TaxID=2751 RepID=UPI0039AFAC42
MSHSPMAIYLQQLSMRLKEIGIPVSFSLPPPEQKEPFIVINQHIDSDDPTAKTGKAIVDSDLSISLFTPLDDRAELEDMIYLVKSKIGRSRSISSETAKDKTGARECYHTAIRVNNLII